MSRSYRPVHSCSPVSGAISSAVTRILLDGAADRTLDQIGGVDLARDQARADILALERERRGPAQHPVERLQRQRVDQVLGQPVGKIFVRAFAQIGERQHADDRGPVVRRQAVDGGGAARQGAVVGAFGLPGPDMDRLLDILEPVRTGIDQRDTEALAGLMVGLARDRDAAGRGDRFQADGDVDVVAEHLVLIGHHVAHVDAHAELHDAVGGQVGVALRHHHLHRDRGLDGADDAREFQQEAVAGVLHQAAAMIEDDRVDRGTVGLEGGVRARLVGPHHAGIAGDVSADDGCQASLHIPVISLMVPKWAIPATWSTGQFQWLIKYAVTAEADPK